MQNIFGIKKPQKIDDSFNFYENPKRSKILELYQNSSIYLYTSNQNESWGLPVLEAMANKCVVIGNYSGCVKEIGANMENLVITDGNIEYYKCDSCKKYFKDDKGTTEINLVDTIVKASEHSYGEPTWSWTSDTQAVATFKCKNGDDSQEFKGIMSSKITKDATCDAKGIRTYTAKVTFGGKEYTATKDIEIPALSCNTSQGNDQPYDDGGPFTRNECGDVFDRWGNLIYDAPDCVVKPKPTTSPQTTLKPENTTEATLEPVKTEEPEQSVEPEKTTTPKPTIQASSTPDSDVKVEKENSFGFIWWILGGIGVVIVGIVAYLVIKNNTEDDE